MFNSNQQLLKRKTNIGERKREDQARHFHQVVLVVNLADKLLTNSSQKINRTNFQVENNQQRFVISLGNSKKETTKQKFIFKLIFKISAIRRKSNLIEHFIFQFYYSDLFVQLLNITKVRVGIIISLNHQINEMPLKFPTTTATTSSTSITKKRTTIAIEKN